jgi:hypothetical protein
MQGSRTQATRSSGLVRAQRRREDLMRFRLSVQPLGLFTFFNRDPENSSQAATAAPPATKLGPYYQPISATCMGLPIARLTIKRR